MTIRVQQTGSGTTVRVTSGLGGPGSNGLGWTGGSYDVPSGIVTFTSTDGLGFSTGDLRGSNGTGWTGGSYASGTGIVTFSSDDGLGFATGDLRGVAGSAGDGIEAILYDPAVAGTGFAIGQWVASYRAKTVGTFDTFFGQITHGESGDSMNVEVVVGGSISNGLIVGGTTVHGPVDVDYGTPVTTGSLSMTVSEGDIVSFRVNSVTGTPHGFALQIDGIV